MWRILFQKIINGKMVYGKASGFFCIIQDEQEEEIPFNKVLITNNHVLDRNSIKPKNYIKMIYLNKNKSIQIQKNRRCFTNEKLVYTCFETFDSNWIEDFFLIDKIVFTGKKFLLKDEIFILQYPDEGDLSFSPGKILLVKDKILHQSASIENGSSGSPIIRRYTKDIIGLHFGGQKSNKIKNDNEDIFIYNLGIPFDSIINDINYN